VAKSVQDKILDGTLKDQINIMKLSETEINKALNLLLESRKEIIAQIVSIDVTGTLKTATQKNRLKTLYNNVNDIIDDYYTQISENSNGALLNLAKHEAFILPKIIDEAIGIPVMAPELSLNKIRSVVNKSMVDGELIGTWWYTQAKDFKSNFKKSMSSITKKFQIGMVQSQTLGEMITAMASDGQIMGYNRRNVEALIRTSSAQVADDIRQATFGENEDIMTGERWVSVFDLRTTPICRALSGNEWDSKHKNIKGGMKYQRPPAHWQCRSVMMPVTKTYEEMLKKKPQLRHLTTGQQASMNGLVSADLNYNSWMKTLSKEEQIDILGKKRYNLWEKGNLSTMDMIKQNGTPLTIEELNKKVGRIE